MPVFCEKMANTKNLEGPKSEPEMTPEALGGATLHSSTRRVRKQAPERAGSLPNTSLGDQNSGPTGPKFGLKKDRKTSQTTAKQAHRAQTRLIRTRRGEIDSRASFWHVQKESSYSHPWVAIATHWWLEPPMGGSSHQLVAPATH